MKDSLTSLGLSDFESEVYLTLLKSGPITANRIVELTGAKRSTTYDTLKVLAVKGLVNSRLENNVAVFQAADPEALVEQEKDRLRLAHELLPKLKSVQNKIPSRSSASFHVGKLGVKAVLDSVVSSNVKEFIFIGSRKEAKKVLAHYPANVLLKRIELGIRTRGVLDPADRLDEGYQDKRARELSDYRYHDSMKGIPSNIFIYGDSVAFMTSTQDLVGCVIHNKDISNALRCVFELIWKQSKALPWPKLPKKGD